MKMTSTLRLPSHSRCSYLPHTQSKLEHLLWSIGRWHTHHKSQHQNSPVHIQEGSLCTLFVPSVHSYFCPLDTSCSPFRLYRRKFPPDIRCIQLIRLRTASQRCMECTAFPLRVLSSWSRCSQGICCTLPCLEQPRTYQDYRECSRRRKSPPIARNICQSGTANK